MVDPRKKLSFFYQSITERLSELWQPPVFID